MLTSIKESKFRELQWHLGDSIGNTVYGQHHESIWDIHEMSLNCVSEIQEILRRIYEDKIRIRF